MRRESLCLFLICLYLISADVATATTHPCINDVAKFCPLLSMNPDEYIYYAFHSPPFSLKAGRKVVKFGIHKPDPKKNAPSDETRVFRDRYTGERSYLISECLEELNFVKRNGQVYEFVTNLANKRDTVEACVREKMKFLGTIRCKTTEKCMDEYFQCAIQVKERFKLKRVAFKTLDLGFLKFDYTRMRSHVPYLNTGGTEWFEYTGDKQIHEVLADIFTKPPYVSTFLVHHYCSLCLALYCVLIICFMCAMSLYIYALCDPLIYAAHLNSPNWIVGRQNLPYLIPLYLVKLPRHRQQQRQLRQ